MGIKLSVICIYFNATATTEIYTLSLHDALPIFERDRFILQRQNRTGGRIYRHPDGRVTVVHYHRSNQTFR